MEAQAPSAEALAAAGSRDARSPQKPPPHLMASPISRRGVVQVSPRTGTDFVHTRSREGAGAEQRSDECKETAFKSLIFGLINSVVIIPVLVGFAQIIFQDRFFAPYQPLTVKLTIFASVVHQVIFTCCSSLPFAVGQVQDAGLIFLSTMAGSVVELVRAKGGSDEEIVATTLFVLAVSTFSLGIALVLIGWFRLASLVQYLPMPVVGGYLAYIGFYCFDAGLALMTGLQINATDPASMLQLLDWDAFLHFSPGVFLGVMIYVLARKLQHFAVLPTLLVVIPIGFYIVLFACGSDLETAREQNWMDKDTTSVPFYEMWELFKLNKVHWDVLPKQIPTWLGMTFIVAFSSCLDVAAIQVDLGRPLDFNHELKTVGLSNILSGLFGGFTGSYIFSQTIFTMRTGIRSRAIGGLIAFFEFGFFLLPFSILAYVPSLFFGAILTFIAVDLCWDWLIESRHKFSFSEYILVWVSFVTINFLQLEVGMLVSIGITALVFVSQTAMSGSQVRAVAPRSSVVRDMEHRQLLASRRGQILAFRISGHIFFGSALRILRGVEDMLPKDAGNDEDTVMRSVVGAGPGGANSVSSSVVAPAAVAAAACRPSFVILDLSGVTGLDATASSTCFQPLLRISMEQGAKLVVAGCSDEVAVLLRKNSVLAAEGESPESGSKAQAFRTMDLAVEWCEEALLRGAQKHGPAGDKPVRGTSLADALARSTGLKDLEDDLEPFFARQEVREGEDIFTAGASADEVYVVNRGSIELLASDDTRLQRCGEGAFVGDLDFLLERPRSFRARAVGGDAGLWRLSRESLERLVSERPELGARFQLAMSQSLALSVREVLIDLC